MPPQSIRHCIHRAAIFAAALGAALSGAANAADLALTPSKDVTAFARVRLAVRAGRTIYNAKAQPVN
jgi:hypothetical protein